MHVRHGVVAVASALLVGTAPAHAAPALVDRDAAPRFADDALLCFPIPEGTWTGFASATGVVRVVPPTIDMTMPMNATWNTVVLDVDPIVTTVGGFPVCVGTEGDVASGYVAFAFDLSGVTGDGGEELVCWYDASGRHCG